MLSVQNSVYLYYPEISHEVAGEGTTYYSLEKSPPLLPFPSILPPSGVVRWEPVGRLPHGDVCCAVGGELPRSEPGA